MWNVLFIFCIIILVRAEKKGLSFSHKSISISDVGRWGLALLSMFQFILKVLDKCWVRLEQLWGWSLQFGLGCWLVGNQPAALADC